MNVQDRLFAASNEKLDRASLRVRLAKQVASLQSQVLVAPVLSPRFQRLIEEPARLKEMDAEVLVDAFAEVIDEADEPLQDELLELTITVARLGSVLLAMRLGRKLFAEMGAGAA